ncbi:MAG: amidohydrolase [Parvibaculaceae bacterium]
MNSLTLKNGRILTFDPDRPLARSLHCRAGRIVSLADDAAEAPADRVIDLGGRTVIPGLIDAHAHLYWMADDRLRLDVAKLGIGRIADLLDVLRDAAGDAEWIVAIGVNERRLAERRLPTRDELDRVSGGRPTALKRLCGHTAVANSAALARLGFDRPMPQVTGGIVETDNGRPTGVLRERAADMLFALLPGPPGGEMADSLAAVAKDYVSRGVTGVSEAAVGFTAGFDREWSAWTAVRARGSFPLRMDFMLGLTAELASAADITPVEDLDWQLRTLKFFADGTLGNRTAALGRPYQGVSDWRGLLLQPAERLIAEFRAARASGWEIAVHAIGDAGIYAAAAALEAIAADRPGCGRPRIEHLAMPNERALAGLLRCRAAIVTQYGFLRAMGDSFVDAIGEDRARGLYPGRSLIDRGFTVAGSSDAPATPLSPFYGIAAAHRRASDGGLPLNEGESLTIEQGFEIYTRGAAAVLGHRAERGVLKRGACADLAVLDRDPLHCAPDELESCGVELTVIRGAVVHENRQRRQAR